MHDHHCDCKHTELSFCKKCDLVYCGDCKREWQNPCTQSHYPYGWYTTPTYVPTITEPSGPWYVTTTGVYDSNATDFISDMASVACDHAS